MAMLAGPRKKQKFSVDPRGSLWSKDENKFGQKMLERMGWSQGRGLGANEDGRVEHIKISHKDDNRGVGCSKSQADNWIAHQDDFNSLLASLNQNYSAEPVEDSAQAGEASTVMSLEKKSKSAKSRVHYQKFTKGKDLSSRRLEDLDCIFGRRKHKKHSNKHGLDAVEKTETFGVQTFQSEDSMQGYFAKKMAKLNGSKENHVHVNDASDETTDKDCTNMEDSDKDTCEGGLQTFNSSQSVQDYFAQKMAKFQRGSQGKDTKPEHNPESKPEEVVVESICVNDHAAEEENINSGSKRKKQKKRKRNRDELLSSECDSEACKKKKGKKVADMEEKSPENEETSKVMDKESRKKAKKEKKRKKEAELCNSDAEIECISITPCSDKVAETTAHKEFNKAPRRKSVRFRNPIVSVLGEKTEDSDNSRDLSSLDIQSIDSADLSNTAEQRDLDLANTSQKQKKKKSKKSKRAEVDESNESLVANADSSFSENEPGMVVVSGDNEHIKSQSEQEKFVNKGKQKAVHSDGLESVRSPSKKTVHLNLIRPELGDLPTKFVGSNINKIPGYSRRSSTLEDCL